MRNTRWMTRTWGSSPSRCSPPSKPQRLRNPAATCSGLPETALPRPGAMAPVAALDPPKQYSMDTFLVSLLNGIIYGLLLFMVSAGLTLIFGMMGVLNFAHASFYMLGAYFAYALSPVIG